LTSDVSAVRCVLDEVRHPALLLVDAVASLGAIDFRMDEWRVDVAVAASQKALMSPPGLSFTSVSPKALAAAERSGSPRYYWDWRKRRSEEWYDWFCGTAPEHLLFGLREAIDMVEEEGLEAIFARHARIARAVRAAVEVWSGAGAVELNARREAEASNSVSTVRVGKAFDAAVINDVCRERFNVSLGGGLGRLAGRAFRIGHMGDVNEAMIWGTLASVEAALSICGIPHRRGGVDAAIETALPTVSAEHPGRADAAR
jgi:alanine-glyoxylate transaminase/serine-glyoxylate transaminase/serine-pyruvate transaminase